MFGKNLKYYRLKNNMSMKELADLVQISPMAISHYEKEERRPDMQTIKATVELVSVDDDEAEAEAEEKMLIEVTLPLQSETITVTFIPEGEESALATLYVKSNAMGIVTSNETIKNNVQDLKVIPLESSLYVTNGKGNYVIVNMLGQVIATGIITSDTQYVNMPNVPKGIYMISIKDKTKRTTVKFVR